MIETFAYFPSQVQKILTGTLRKTWPSETKLTHITTSSLESHAGCLFVPLRGARDGHDFIADALARNAEYFLCEKGHPVLNTLDAAQKSRAILVTDTYKALADLAIFHRRRFAPLVIGITGSNGKTTTKELIGTIRHLLPDGECVVTEKNYNNEIGLPFTVLKMNENTRCAVLEMGMNHAGEISRLSHIAAPDIAVITNIGRAHIENLGSTEKIALAKAEIMNSMNKTGKLVIPRNILHKSLVRKIAREKKVSVVEGDFSTMAACVISQSAGGYVFDLNGNRFEWPFPGERIALNVVLAALVFKLAGFSPAETTKALANYQPPKGRMHVHHDYYTIIDDTYNANPDSAESSILAAVQIAQGKPVAFVLGDFKEIGKFSKKLHFETGVFAARSGVTAIITLGKDSQQVNKGFETQAKSGKGRATLSAHFTDTPENIARIREFVSSNLPKGAVILIKGSRSMRMERVVAEFLQQDKA